MKIYSDTLTTDDLYAALPADVTIADIRAMKNPRKRQRGWELALEGYDNRHTRRRNSGMYGANGYGYAATWDDHGLWMDNLYRKDPQALIAWYKDREHFYSATRQESEWRKRSRFALVRKHGQAPWLLTDTQRAARDRESFLYGT